MQKIDDERKKGKIWSREFIKFQTE